MSSFSLLRNRVLTVSENTEGISNLDNGGLWVQIQKFSEFLKELSGVEGVSRSHPKPLLICHSLSLKLFLVDSEVQEIYVSLQLNVIS